MTTIDMGSLELRFLQSKESSGGSLDVFEMVLQARGNMPVPHYHESFDETVYGLKGTTTWTIGSAPFDVGPGESVFIKRGVPHGFSNNTDQAATCLCILTPGLIGPSYFQEMAGLLSAEMPDRERLGETMRRYGLIPAVLAPPQ